MAAFAWFAGTLNMWSYLRHVVVLPGNPHANLLVMPPIILVGVFVIPSLVFGLAVLLWRAFVIWNDPWRAALVVPAVWVTYEYLVGVTSAHGTFGNLVYTQMNFLPVLQLASVFGVWGVTFCVLFFAAAVAALLSGAGTAGQRQMFAAAAGLLMLVMLTFGWWRVHFMPEPEHSVTVGLLASDLPQTAYAATLRIQLAAGNNARTGLGAVRHVGCRDLQGHGFPASEPAIRKGWRGPALSPGVGFWR